MDAISELREIGKPILDAIKTLDDDAYKSRTECEQLIEFLREEFSPRESMLVLKAETMKEGLGSTLGDQKKRFEIDAYVYDIMAKIDESGYLGINAKNRFRKPRMPILEAPKQKRIRTRIKTSLGPPKFRFAYSEDYSCIKDVRHTKAEHYKIKPYEGLNNSSVFVEIFEALLKGALDAKSGGWVHSRGTWRGALRKDPYRRFRDEQIFRGDMRKGHNGFWRFFTDGEFDEESPAGKFFKRKHPNG